MTALDRLFYPRGVAVVGSVGEGKLGYYLMRQILAGGYRAVYAVNPKAQGLPGAPGFAQVATIDGPVDLAVIASPAASVPAVLADCGAAGVSAAVIITSGFGETGNRAGEDEIRRVAAEHGIRVIGPNCAGIANTGHHLFATLEVRPPAGTTALISQSGALAGAVLAWAEEQGLGFSKFVSYGNRADVGEAELLRYLATDEQTRVVALYVESVADGRDFMDALAACSRRKPVVAIKAGRSAVGQRATLSHTGSLAGADTVYDAALAACGALRVKGVEEMFDLCKGFASLPPMRGRRLAIVTNSGGPGVLAADQAEALGLTVAEPDPALHARLAAGLPAHCALRNPIDLTVEGTEQGYRETLASLLDPQPGAQPGAAGEPPAAAYDAALALNVNVPYLDSVPLARGVHAAIERTGKPIVVNFMAGSTVAAGLAYLAEHGIPNYPTGERAVAVLAHMATYQEWLAADTRRTRAGAGRDASRDGIMDRSAPRVGRRVSLPRGPWLEPAAMAWLRDQGFPVPRFSVACSEEEAAAAATALGYPVVMKVVSPDILHKSDCGGVIVGVRNGRAARAAYHALAAAAAGADLRGVIIYPMVQGGQEVLVGLARDPQFGPVVVCGLGGIYTEVLRDVALRVAPVDCESALAMLRSLRGAAVLAGARGRPACDLEALAALVAQVSELPFRYPEIGEIDLNPVFALPHGALIGDVRIITA